MEPTIATNSATATGTGDVCSMDSPACQAVFIAQRPPVIAQRRPPVSAHQRRKHDRVRVLHPGTPRRGSRLEEPRSAGRLTREKRHEMVVGFDIVLSLAL